MTSTPDQEPSPQVEEGEARVTARQIVIEEWHKAVKQFGLLPGSEVEFVVGSICNRFDALAAAPALPVHGEGVAQEIVRDLRARREMRDGGNGNVYDVADELCERAADEIERLSALRAAKPEDREWQPIETAPSRKIVLVSNPEEGDLPIVAKKVGGQWVNIGAIPVTPAPHRFTLEPEPTHWRPLPAPPRLSPPHKQGGGK
jgi:hypothetical protein